MKNLTLTLGTVLSSFLLLAQETNGLLFDGTDDQVILSGTENTNLGTGDFTFEVVCKVDFNQLEFPIFLSNRQVVNQGFLFGIYGSYDGTGRLWTQIDGINHPINIGGINLMDNMCHHVALTRSSDSLRYYIDGIKVYSLPANLGTIDTNHPFWIGNDEPTTTTPFNGVIKEVRIWNFSRSDLDINDYSSTQLLGNETGLIGYWRLDEGAGQTVNDLNSSGNIGGLGSTLSLDVNDPTWTNDCGIDFNTTSIEKTESEVKKELVKIVDLLGRETNLKPNIPLIKIFSDGSTERIIQLDY